MTAEEPVLLATKLHPPVPRRGLISRPRLVAQLASSTERQLTLLDAPAGWGKTWLLADWNASPQRAKRVAWLGLDPGDNDLVRFWIYLVTALRQCAPEVGGRALAMLPAGHWALREAALPSLVNDLDSHAADDDPIVLVLDDYHAINNSEVHSTFTYLIDHLPPRLHLVIATRADPPLPLGRLRAAGGLVELRAADLCFTDEEVTEFLSRTVGPVLSAEDVLRLARRTEGWPAGLSLAALSLAGRTDPGAFVAQFTGSDRYVLDYLSDEVLARLPAEFSEFLLRTALLRRLCAPLCTAVTGRLDAGALLDRIERGGGFLVPLDTVGRWYRHHRLFRELLAHELTLTEPELVPELHRRAARWFADAGEVPDAIEHTVACGDGPAAAELVAKHWNRYFNEGQLATVTNWLDLLDPDLVDSDPRLCIARAWLALDFGRLGDAQRWLSAGDAAASDDTTVLRDLAVLRSVQRFKVGDVSAAHDAARRVLELNRGEVCFAATVASLILGVTLVWHGELLAAQRPLRDAVRLARRTDNRLADAYALGYLALAAVERGALDEAEELLKPALDRAADPAVAEHFVTMMPRLAHATVLAASGELTEAVASAARAVQLARRGAGRLELALALAVQAQAAAATGRDGRKALEEARAVVRGCRDPGWLPDRLARLRRDVTARPGTEGRSLNRSGAAEPPDRIILSDRERELLPLLGGTLSQREIGAVLHVSLNTVKTHSRLLFRKLRVSSRAEAVARARALGLLPEPRGQSTVASSSADTGSVASPVNSRPSSRARSISP